MDLHRWISVNEPILDGREKEYLLECIETGWISSEGPFVERFEQEFAKAVNRKHGIACANGSGALDIAVAAAGIGPDDEVIMPTFTIISPAASVVRAGGTPVLVDSGPITWNLNVAQIEEQITTRTKAILAVHIYGLPVDMDPVMDIAARHGLMVIEDAAEMHGQTYKGRPCGSFGLMSTFSFYPNKHITCGEGGMVVTDDDSVADHCRRLRNLCFQSGRRFVHEELGWNYRMTNMQAALGLAQLEKLDNHVRRKREMGRLYQEQLASIPGLQLPLPRTDYAENIYWVFGIVLDERLGVDAEAFAQRMAAKRVGTRPFFYPMHRQPVFLRDERFSRASFPTADRLAQQGLYLPSGLAITESDLLHVVTVVKECISQ